MCCGRAALWRDSGGSGRTMLVEGLYPSLFLKTTLNRIVVKLTYVNTVQYIHQTEENCSRGEGTKGSVRFALSLYNFNAVGGGGRRERI